jgi:hypothetical protein
VFNGPEQEGALLFKMKKMPKDKEATRLSIRLRKWKKQEKLAT